MAPPIAGPPIEPTWNTPEDHVSAFGKYAGGTSSARMLWLAGEENARASPIARLHDNSHPSWVEPDASKLARPSVAAETPNQHNDRSVRRSKRSAAAPMRGQSTSVGKNCASPTQPRSIALPVSS